MTRILTQRRTLDPNFVGSIVAEEFANETARLAATGFAGAPMFLDTDVGRVARDLDTDELHWLTETTPTWAALGAGGGGSSGPPGVYVVSSTTTHDVTNALEVPITGMAITPPAGTYRVDFNTAADLSVDRMVIFNFAVDGVAVASTQRFMSLIAQQPVHSFSGVVTVDGTEEITAVASIPLGTWSFLNRQMYVTEITVLTP